jgi:hypothetical protein
MRIIKMKKAIFDHKAVLSLIKCCFFAVFMFASAQSIAQTRGKVQVVRDPLFDTLLTRRAELNKGLGNSGNGGGGIYTSSFGYRVQIYNGSNRTAAYNAQAKFNTEFPDMRTYISYREPNFKVRAGDFRSRLEAEKIREQLKPWFSVMFIVSEKINPPKTGTND